MATIDEATKPDIEERYQTASNTSNLIATGGDADCGGAVDVLIAAAWSASRVGMALLRLHSEFDASEKPLKPTPALIGGLVGTYQRAIPSGEQKPGQDCAPARKLTHAEAVQYAGAWYMHEMGLLLGKMKALPTVREQITVQAMRWGMGKSSDPITRSDITQSREHDAAWLTRLRAEVEAAGQDEHAATVARASLNVAVREVNHRRHLEHRAEVNRATEKAAGVIRYWLSQTCPVCHGLRWQLVPGAPALSNRVCKTCDGGGVGQVPHGQEGRRLANWMDSCVQDARGLLRRNLSSRRKQSVPIDEK